MPMLSTTAPALRRDFLRDGGIMGELIRAKNWSATPLGPCEEWPQSLRTAVSLCLASSFPINLIWGPGHVQIYNDGYRPICAGKHPQSLGEDYTQTWASAWESLDEAFTKALAGETSYLENRRMFLDRNSYLEESFFTFSLSPIRDESGEIGGLFHPVTETTGQMLSQRRNRSLQELALRSGQAKSVEEACALAAQALSLNQWDLPFVLIYLLDESGRQANLVAHAHLPPGAPASPPTIQIAPSTGSSWNLHEAIQSGAPVIVTGLAHLFGPLACGPYPESPERALLLPILTPGLDLPVGFVIAGASPRLPFTGDYRAFFDLVGAAVTAAITNARAHQAERQRAETLAVLDKTKTAFFNNVSHEFRTPLTLMLGPLEEMLAQAGDRLAVERESVDLVHRNGLRLLRLVNTLLDFSRLEAHRVEAQFEQLDLASFTRHTASVFRAVTEKAGIALRINCPTLSEDIFVDREMWEKILFNLLSNAFKFTLAGAITVSLREASGHVELSVSDTGAGIPQTELSHLFKRFHRVLGAPGRSYEGSGIGLALVDELTKLHGGSVRVESELGRGTTFYVTLLKGSRHLPPEHLRPARSSPGAPLGEMFVEEALHWLPAAAPVNAPLPAAATHRRYVLLADDNADMRRYIESILAPEFEIETVPDGAAALQAIERRLPDLVLTDVMMPNLDGFGLLKALRAGKHTRGIPIIMLSARSGEEARVEGIQAGADDYLTKPFNARELRARVKVNAELAELRLQLSRDRQRLPTAPQIEQQWRVFDMALSHTPDFVYLLDLQGRFIYANRALLESERISLDDLVGHTVAALGRSPERVLQVQQQLAQVAASRAPLTCDSSFNDPAVGVRHYQYTFVPVFSKEGPLEAVAGSMRDVTEWSETNRALRQLNADLEQFTYSASHDLKAPLRVLDNAARWLEEDLAPHLTKETREIIALMRSRVRRMEKLLDDLLQYARIGRAPDRRCQDMVGGHLLVNDVLALLSLEGFTVSVSPAFSSICVPRMPLQQILLNLIDNAIKHHRSKLGHIELSVEDHGSSYAFAVKDDGPGIPEQFHQEVFKMFRTLRPRDEVEGSGLGLAIVRKNLDIYGGVIDLQSAEGVGTTIRFTLPKQFKLPAIKEDD